MTTSGAAGRHDRRIAFAVTGLLLLALAYTLHTASFILVPVMLAAFLALLLFPIVRRLRRFGIPRALTAGLLVITLLGAASFTLYTVSEPAEAWLERAPTSLRQLRERSLQGEDRMEDIKALADEVDELTKVEESEKKPERDKPQPVTIEKPGIFKELVGELPTLAAQLVIVVFLTFFLLVTSDTILLKIVRWGKTWGQRRRIVTVGRSIQRELSRYLGLVTIINAGLGVATGLFLWVLGVPNPFMWGTAVAVLNFAPYLGAMTSTVLLTVVGLTTFPTPTEALLVPAGFFFLTTLEGQVVTPALVGRHHSINPTVVLLSVIFWGWLWGIAGALMAVPLLTCFKVFCDSYPPLHLAGDFLATGR